MIGHTFRRAGDLAVHTIVAEDATHYTVVRESWGLASAIRYQLRKTALEVVAS